MKRLNAVGLALLFAAPLWGQEPKLEREVVYGKAPGKDGEVELKLDLATPGDGDGPFPVMVFLHGGGWRAGSRKEFTNTLGVIARRGYVAVTVGYRLVPETAFPGPIEDCKAAVRWLRANAAKYKIDPDHIGVVGFSAGGHLACLLGVTTKEDGLEGKGNNPEQSSAVQAVVSFFGPTDLTVKNWSDDLEMQVLAPFIGGAFADKPDLYKKASPISYVRKGAPPFLFFHGTEDKLVGLRHSKVLAEKLQAVGGAAKVVEMEGEGHGWGGDKIKQSFVQMQQFFDKHLKRKKE